jgi:hypothetical protein
MIYMLIIAVVFAAVFGARLLVFLAWLLALPVLFIWDVIVGFVQGARTDRSYHVGQPTYCVSSPRAAQSPFRH